MSVRAKSSFHQSDMQDGGGALSISTEFVSPQAGQSSLSSVSR